MRHADTYFTLAREREQIRRRRTAGQPSPWTTDQIFRDWRFCNVHRENDKTTMWFREHVRSKLSGLSAVEATVTFRWFNRITTGEVVEDLLLHGWDHDEALRRLSTTSDTQSIFTGACKTSHHSRGRLFTGAYIIKSPDGKSKLYGILECIDEARRRLRVLVPNWGASLEGAWSDLRTCPFLGGFMAYEVVSDLRWTPVLGEASDICTWCHVGPGATRGLGLVVAGDVGTFSQGQQRKMLPLLAELLEMSRDMRHWPDTWAEWEMREVEHWLCEYAKYSYAASGHRLRRRYRPT